MEFRTIKYMKKKDINLENCKISPNVKEIIQEANEEDAFVLRLCIDDDNIVIIEYAGLINLENIKEACKID